MIPDLPPDAVYVRWGRFQAAVQGRLALIVIALIVAAIVFASVL